MPKFTIPYSDYSIFLNQRLLFFSFLTLGKNRTKMSEMCYNDKDNGDGTSRTLLFPIFFINLTPSRTRVKSSFPQKARSPGLFFTPRRRVVLLLQIYSVPAEAEPDSVTAGPEAS